MLIFFLSLKMYKWLVFLIIPKERNSSVAVTKEDFHESVLDLRIYIQMKITANHRYPWLQPKLINMYES